ncbi:MATE family efflux transporter [Alkaliphilus peptidifermentans]|uniref:Multidrug export protein MepA n=1 Tax=Alkaliphilus peptidifermentans DSM 18978 TaxID=1120976 RepID=A0A1G5L691_9FIRM|nr:MATE family efflux transporter [Alkaliphilus peptidifermentans]SCZ08387.1 putative efflux protein, MATE family [Alkaliphilus peptidifermentans DSM 18978]
MNDHSKILGNEAIGKLLFRLSAPAVIGMMVQALYNLVDTIFVGRGVGTMAIAGLAIAFPLQMISLAIAQAIGIGGASIISRSMGSGDNERAERAMGNIFSLVIVVSIVITILGLAFMEPILMIFGATESILPYSMEYMGVILLGTVLFTFAVASNSILRAEGNAKMAMITMLISAGLNIILDPIFIFVFRMGIRGAAIATVLAQATTAIYLVIYFVSGKSTLKFKVENLKPDLKIINETFAIGSSAFARQVAGSFMAIILNNSLAFYGGDITIAAFGVINRLLMFTFMPLFGVVQGLQPIVGYNYGAKQFDRVKKTINLSIIVTTLLATLGFVMLMVFPRFFMEIFSDDVELINLSVGAVRVIVLGIPFIGLQVVGASMYQAIGKALPSLILSMSRQILFLIPLVLILPMYFNLDGIWYAFPLADILSTVVTMVFMSKELRILTNSSILENS